MSSVLRPHQHSIGYMGDGFYRSKDPTNSIKVLYCRWDGKTSDLLNVTETQNVVVREYGRTQPISAGKLEIEMVTVVQYHIM